MEGQRNLDTPGVVLAVVRKESVDTEEYEPYKQKGMDVDVDENEDDLSFVPSVNPVQVWWTMPREAVDASGWYVSSF